MEATLIGSTGSTRRLSRITQPRTHGLGGLWASPDARSGWAVGKPGCTAWEGYGQAGRHVPGWAVGKPDATFPGGLWASPDASFPGGLRSPSGGPGAEPRG
jgi:hypothetical protein